MNNSATANGTKNFKNRFPDLAKNHFHTAQNLQLSSIGIGTYLGNWDEETDASYVDSIVEFAEKGGNVIDTAANYRFQRSERNIGKALKTLFADGFSREDFFVATKAGFLAFDGAPARDAKSFFEKNFVEKGIAKSEDLVGGSHCIAPDYLQSQIDQSLENMELDALDLFYIHNPESQLQEVDKYTFEAKIAKAFEKLEENRADGKIKFYGAATWNGFRVAPDDASYHSLERFVNIADQIAGKDHGFKFIQLPLNLAMPEAHLLKNQAVSGESLHAARSRARTRRFGDVFRFDSARENRAGRAALHPRNSRKSDDRRDERNSIRALDSVCNDRARRNEQPAPRCGKYGIS